MKRNYQYDVVVVGGGTSGVAAAVGAVQAGAKTLLIERNPYLGGEATHSGVAAFCGFFSCDEHLSRTVAGVGAKVVEEMEKLGPQSVDYIISAAGHKNINFRPEYLKCAMDNVLEAAGVDLLLKAYMVKATVKEKRIISLLCLDDEGEFTVEGTTFVDASGDANLTRLAGAKTLWGDGQTVQAATLPFRLCNVDTTQDMSPNAVEKAILQAKAAKIPFLTREKGFILKQKTSHVVSVLLPSFIPLNLTSEEQTKKEIDTRKQVMSYVEALHRYMPGMEKCELVVIGPDIGYRETRRIVGKYEVTTDDVLERRKNKQGVARCGWKPEIHKDVNKMGTYLEVKDGSYFDIPLGALQSADLDNLYASGRMISSDPIAFAAIRVMGVCFATGHAAGVGAAYQAIHGMAGVEQVRAELTRQGALV